MRDTLLLPEAFLAEMRELLGAEFDQYIKSYDEEWKPGLRVNTLKLSPESFKEVFPWKLEPVSWTENGFYYDAQERPSRHPAYYAGLYYLQEPSAMTPAAMLPVEPGDKVLDVCAAPGGKSTELAAKLKGRGLLVSNDISYSRARALLKNLELAGAANIAVVSEEPGKLAAVWPEFFDKILVDAPCSGEGMFRRDEDMVKDWRERGPKYYSPLQKEILKQSVVMLKPGGMLLYSTCTFSKKEDEDNVSFLLKECPEMELVPLKTGAVCGALDGIGLSGCMRLFPHRVKGEGHFLALLRKKEKGMGGEQNVQPFGEPEMEDAPPEQKERGRLKDRRGKSPKDSQRCSARTGAKVQDQTTDEGKRELEAFLKMCRVRWETERIFIHQENAYYLPEGLKPGLPLRFLRTGLLLGELKKGRFEPSQALAMALKAEEFGTLLDLTEEDPRVLRYLKGETISLLPEESPVKGWCLVAYRGFPLGWAKGNGMSLKNKYYPGWRWQ